MNPPQTQGSYSGGYDLALLLGLAQRQVGREAAFLVPHLQPGMRVLDCGCGPGGISLGLARLVAPGSVIGVDVHSDQLDIGRLKACLEGIDNVEFQAASIYALPFADESFDAALVHAVLYHLDRPAQALTELRRVLKPGGLIGARDTDLDGDLYYPSHPQVDRFWKLVERVHAHHGGDIRLGRKHRKLFREAGFERLVATASCDTCGTPETTDAFSRYWSEGFLEQHRALILEQQWCENEDLEAMRAGLSDWGSSPDAFYSRCRCELVGWKPL